MIAVRLPKDLDDRLTNFSRETNRSKSYYLRKALQEYLDDEEDYLLLIESLKNDDGKRYSLEEVRKQLGLED